MSRSSVSRHSTLLTRITQSQRLLEVALLAALPADLPKEHGGEETNVPGDHVQPDLVIEGGALGEVGHVGANALSEGACA